MKVFIGKYPDRWTTSRLENWWLEYNHGKNWMDVVNNNEETDVDKFVEKVCDILQTVLNVTVNQYFDRKKRKVKVRIDRQDTWGMYATLAHVILPMLKQLQETKHGSPFVDDEDVPHNLRSMQDTEWSNEDLRRDGSTDKYFHDRWDWVMDEMIWAFEQVVNDIEYIHDDKGNYDKDATRKHNERKQKGFELFGKYYNDLWD